MLKKKMKESEHSKFLSIFGENHFRGKQLHEEIQKLVEMEECMWNQWAKADWLQDGDQNTEYSHCKSIEHNKRNYILGLENKLGEGIEKDKQISNLLTQYYSNQFTSSNLTHLELVLEGVNPKVSVEMNVEWLRPFEPSEVQGALKQMESSTTPGLNGLPPLL